MSKERRKDRVKHEECPPWIGTHDFFAMDGRANHDIDRAIVHCVYNNMTLKRAARYFRADSQGMDLVLVHCGPSGKLTPLYLDNMAF